MKINMDVIIRDDNPLLREKSVDVTLPLSAEDKELLTAMITYVRDSRDEELAEKENLRPAVGLAAPQVGVLKRMIAVVVDEWKNDDEVILHEFALVNPRIVAHSEAKSMLSNGEGCLSVDEVIDGYVPRFARIRVRGYDLLREQHVEIKAHGYLSIVLQHEIDHLNGIMFYDHINKEEPWKPIENALLID